MNRAMVKLGLVSNPRSQLNEGGMKGIEEAVGANSDILHARLDDVAALPDVLGEFARREVGVIAVNGGDGTVQAVLTELLETRPFDAVPPLALLARGMTNMIATDVGLRGSPPKALRRLASLVRNGVANGHLVARNVVRLQNAAGFPPQRGMFFGAAGVLRAIELCRTKVHTVGMSSGWANAVTLITLLLRWTLSGNDRKGLGGENIAVSLEGGPMEESARLLVLATTLDRLILNARPFWNSDQGPLRYTSIAYPPKRLANRALKVLYGGADRGLPAESYESRGVTHAELEMRCRFTLDGQLFVPTTGKPIVLSAADQVRFVRV